MRIGLLTTYSFNYGSYHQAISLQKKLQDMGYECELINEKIKMFRWFSLFCMYTINPFLPDRIKQKIADKIPQYNSFLKIQNDTKDLEISPRWSASKLSKRYDCILVGSDELWSASRESIPFFPEYFGYKWKCPLISYGTCAIKLNPKNKRLFYKVKKGLARFKAMSVRDSISLKNVKAIINKKEISFVLDPTMLYPFFIEKDNKINDSERYVLLYGQHYSEKQKQYIMEFAKKEQAHIYSVGWKQEWGSKFIDVTTAKELQRMFAKAMFCFPSTFHGTIFSILNHKQFLAMLNPIRGKKVELLLKQFHLENRIFENLNRKDKLEPIDYHIVEKEIETWRKESEKYLEKALETVKITGKEKHDKKRKNKNR